MAVIKMGFYNDKQYIFFFPVSISEPLDASLSGCTVESSGPTREIRKVLMSAFYQLGLEFTDLLIMFIPFWDTTTINFLLNRDKWVYHFFCKSSERSSAAITYLRTEEIGILFKQVLSM